MSENEKVKIANKLTSPYCMLFFIILSSHIAIRYYSEGHRFHKHPVSYLLPHVHILDALVCEMTIGALFRQLN